jgi:hypothetical protein
MLLLRVNTCVVRWFSCYCYLWIHVWFADFHVIVYLYMHSHYGLNDSTCMIVFVCETCTAIREWAYAAYVYNISVLFLLFWIKLSSCFELFHISQYMYMYIVVRPKKKICVFTVTRPTLIFASDPMHFYTEFG